MSEENNRLRLIAETEGMHWGENVALAYHGVASQHMDAQWAGYIKPLLEKYPPELSRVVDFAAGFGRNTRKLLEAGAAHVTAIDVNPECIQRLKDSFPESKVTPVLVSGYDLAPLESSSFSFVYSFDAMVHFDFEIVFSYIHEFARILQKDGMALLHHSNYSENPGANFETNPHMRNYMTAEAFKHVSSRAGLQVVEQQIFSWGELKNSECFTILRKR